MGEDTNSDIRIDQNILDCLGKSNDRALVMSSTPNIQMAIWRFLHLAASIVNPRVKRIAALKNAGEKKK